MDDVRLAYDTPAGRAWYIGGSGLAGAPADASESDAVLMAFARDEIGLDERRAAQLLDQFRKAREKARGTEVSSA